MKRIHFIIPREEPSDEQKRENKIKCQAARIMALKMMKERLRAL